MGNIIENIKKSISIVRVAFEFYPMKGGSITHIIESAKYINPYLENQIIIAPDFGDTSKDFDASFPIPILRVNYLKFNFLKKIKFPIVPLILFIYSINVLRILKNKKNDYILYIHGTLLGAIICLLNKFYQLNKPIIVFQDSANIFNISKRSALSGHLAFSLFKYSKPDILLIIDDGNKLLDFVNKCKTNNINYSILYHAINTEFFYPQKLKKSDNNFIVLSTQRLDNFKRVDLGIYAFKKFLEKNNFPNNAKLIIVGDGDERNNLNKIVINNNLQNWIEFHGFKEINDIIDYLNNVDVVIGTSLISNLNLSIQEAMACEKAVILFNTGEIDRLIKNFENGILIEPINIEEFAIMIDKLYKYSELRERIGKNARITIIKDRNWESRIKKELEIFNNILKTYYS